MAGNHNKPTVMFGVSFGFEARYLLRTDIFKRIKEAGYRIVIVSPNAKESYFEDEFVDDNVFLEKLELEQYRKYYRSHRLQRFLRLLRQHFLGGKNTDHNPLDDKAESGTLKKKPDKVIVKQVFDAILFVLKKSKLLRRFLVNFECRILRPEIHSEIFQKYRPQALILAQVGYRLADTYLAREACHFGAKVFSVIFSWDKAYGRGYRGINPDHVVCWGESMKDEVCIYQDIKEENVYVAGNAFFDMYNEIDKILPTMDFYEEYGLDPNKKTILFATKSPNSYPNYLILRELAEIVNSGRLEQPCQILTRLHPIHSRPDMLKSPFGRYLARQYQDIANKYDNVSVYWPPAESDSLPMDASQKEIMKIPFQLFHSDIVVTLFSTIILEALCLQKPVINIAYDMTDENIDREFRTIAIDMKQMHLRRISKLGGTHIVYNREELISALNRCILNPEELRVQEKATLLSEIGLVDGKAGERCAEYIMGHLG